VVLARGSDPRFEWLAATHDGYAWLDGAPRPQRLWLVGSDAVWVLDAVRGGGRHRVASRLHLHPDAPPDVDVAALGGSSTDAPDGTGVAGLLRRETAPLHERFGESRDMPRLVFEVETALPWAGGFRIAFGAPLAAPPELALEGGVLRLRAADLDVEWRLDARGPGAVAIRTRAG
jgi:hypothetical protein